MTPASRGQLARMIGAFGSGGVNRFDVGALDHASGKMSLREDWDRGRLWRAAGWIAGRNAAGSSIYVRPARSLEAHPWVLVGGLTSETLVRLRWGAPARDHRRDKPGTLPGVGPGGEGAAGARAEGDCPRTGPQIHRGAGGSRR